MRGVSGLALSLLSLALASPAAAEVRPVIPFSVASHNEVSVPASPIDAWLTLVDVARWWDRAHTYSGNAENLSLDPRPDGCFCEEGPGLQVEHMRVLTAMPQKLLRLSGGLGPLQGEAITGTLTIRLLPQPGGTLISFDYVASGGAAEHNEAMPALVDKMLAGQLASLAARLGKRSG